MPKNNGHEKSLGAYFLRIAGVLTLICSVVALMLAVVNMVTADTIAANTEREKLEAVSRIFGEVDGTEAVTADDHEILLVKYDGAFAGYCVTVKPQGYGGEIEMLVGVTPEKTVKGVQIINMSETPGVGSKVKSDPDFLTQFTGRGEVFTVGENVDAISGASISSRAVTAGINEALSLDFDPASAADDAGITGEHAADTDDTEEADDTTSQGVLVIPDIPLSETGSEPEYYIDKNLIGQGEPASYYYPSDNIYVESRDATYYLESKAPDETETDENGNPVSPETT